MGDTVPPDGEEVPRLRVVSRNENPGPKAIAAGRTPRQPASADIYTSIGECVALRRKERGLTQSEFAFNLGVKLSQLKKYEDGEAILTPDLLLRAAQILDVQPSRFFVVLAEKRLADLSMERFPLEPSISVLDETDKIRIALLETISKCDSIINILDIIDVSKKI